VPSDPKLLAALTPADHPESVRAERDLAATLGESSPVAAEMRERILDLAQDILLRRSFHSFSYQDLAAGIGIRKASIHYYFPSKEDLGVALVERVRDRMHAWAVQLSEEKVPPEEKLAAFFRVLRRLLDAGNKICVYGVLGAEYNALPPRVQAAYCELLEAEQRWLARVLERGRERGVFGFAGEPEQEAVVVSSALQGALQIARASRRADRFEAVIAALESRLRGPAAGVT
jgi:AcrR family transcriptional regulator